MASLGVLEQAAAEVGEAAAEGFLFVFGAADGFGVAFEVGDGEDFVEGELAGGFPAAGHDVSDDVGEQFVECAADEVTAGAFRDPRAEGVAEAVGGHDAADDF